MDVRCLENRSDLANWLPELCVGSPVEGGGAAAWRNQPEQHPQGCRLAGAIGPEEPGHRSFASAEAEVVDSRNVAEALRQSFDLDCCHAILPLSSSFNCAWARSPCRRPQGWFWLCHESGCIAANSAVWHRDRSAARQRCWAEMSVTVERWAVRSSDERSGPETPSRVAASPAGDGFSPGRRLRGRLARVALYDVRACAAGSGVPRAVAAADRRRTARRHPPARTATSVPVD